MTDWPLRLFMIIIISTLVSLEQSLTDIEIKINKVFIKYVNKFIFYRCIKKNGKTILKIMSFS